VPDQTLSAPPGVGPVLSITTSTVSKPVPYFSYSLPGRPTTARTWYCCITSCQNGKAVGRSKAAPRPRSATRRPPARRRFRAWRTWSKPTSLVLTACCPGAEEKGGFIAIRSNVSPWGKTECR